MTKSKEIEMKKLAVARVMNLSSGRMFSVMKDGSLKPIKVNQVTALGTKSSFGIKDEDKSHGNPQRVDSAFLDVESDTLALQYSARFILSPNGNIEMCDNQQIQKVLVDGWGDFIRVGGLQVLIERMLANIAEGKPLWRNQYGETLETTIELSGKSFSFIGFEHMDEKGSVSDPQIKTLAGEIVKSIAKSKSVCLEIEHRVKLGREQEVFPSQDMVEDGRTGNLAKSKHLFKDEHNNAMMHSQKLSNAIKTVDFEYSEDIEFGSIALEPYGALVKKDMAVRKSETSFYTYLAAVAKNESIINQLKTASSHTDVKDALFFYGCMFRGGVYNMVNNKE